MKISNFILSAALVLTCSIPALAQESETVEKDDKKEKRDPQDLRGWTVGLKGLYLYDMFSNVYDTDVSRDLQGLNGDKTGLDFGFDLGLEKQFTPFFGARADFRYGGLSGANNAEYYENSFYSLRIAGIFIWNNWDPQNVGSKLNFYTPVGGGIGYFDAERFLIADDSPNGTAEEFYGMIYGGAGLMYELNSNWRLDLEVDYNIVRTDGFDGFNYGTAWDPYLSTGLGVAYTFGDKEVPAMYATNMYEAPYYDLARQMERLEELESQVGALSEKQEKEAQELRENLEMRGLVDKRQDESIDNLNKRMKEREAIDLNKDSDGYEAVVFFGFDSATLTAQAQQEIMQKLAGKNGPFTVVGFADPVGPNAYNDRLKMRRAEAVKAFLVDQMGYSAEDISLETGAVDVEKQNNFLQRRVEIR